MINRVKLINHLDALGLGKLEPLVEVWWGVHLIATLVLLHGVGQGLRLAGVNMVELLLRSSDQIGDGVYFLGGVGGLARMELRVSDRLGGRLVGLGFGDRFGGNRAGTEVEEGEAREQDDREQDSQSMRAHHAIGGRHEASGKPDRDGGGKRECEVGLRVSLARGRWFGNKCHSVLMLALSKAAKALHS